MYRLLVSDEDDDGVSKLYKVIGATRMVCEYVVMV